MAQFAHLTGTGPIDRRVLWWWTTRSPSSISSGQGSETIHVNDRSLLRQWGHAFKRTSFVRFVRGFFFDGSTVRKAEPMLWQFICDNVGSGWRCVDVGASRGEFSFLMARKTGVSGFVYAFELHPENARLLQSNLWRYRYRVKVENLAVSDGKTELAEVF